MFESIGWGTYAFFAAMNIVIIFPTVWFLFPETKQRSLEDVSQSGHSQVDDQLDMVFAVANAEGRSPVKVSAEGNLPKAGSLEAEQILGRATTLDSTGNHPIRRDAPGTKAPIDGKSRHAEHAADIM